MLNLTVTVNGTDRVVGGLSRFAEKVRAGALRKMAEAAVKSIYTRTQAGKDERDAMLKPIKNTRSTPMFGTGKMMASMGILSATPMNVVIGFKGQREGQKATWQHYGTKGPYPIRPKSGHKALAFKTSMSNANAMLGRGGKGKRLTMGNARSNAQGMAIVRGVMHPGLVPRPFFGISPSNERDMIAAGQTFLNASVKESGL